MAAFSSELYFRKWQQQRVNCAPIGGSWSSPTSSTPPSAASSSLRGVFLPGPVRLWTVLNPGSVLTCYDRPSLLLCASAVTWLAACQLHYSCESGRQQQTSNSRFVRRMNGAFMHRFLKQRRHQHRRLRWKITHYKYVYIYVRMYVSLGVHTYICIYANIYTNPVSNWWWSQMRTSSFLFCFFFYTVKCHSNIGHQDEIIID